MRIHQIQLKSDYWKASRFTNESQSRKRKANTRGVLQDLMQIRVRLFNVQIRYAVRFARGYLTV